MSETEIVCQLVVDLSIQESVISGLKPNTCTLGDEMASNNQSEVLKTIKLIGYKGALLSENELKDALQEGPKSIEYTKLISFLTNGLRELCSLDECVNAIATPEDSSTFLMEVNSFLNELGCPHVRLTQGRISERLSTVEDRLLLIQHLSSELMASRILRKNEPEKRMDLKLKESEQASDLRKILQILTYPQPPRNMTMQGLIQKLTPSIQNLVTKAHKGLVGNPIFNGSLSEKQWEALEKVDRDLHDEYLIRREMLLKRLDCTIQSFQWSDKTKGKDDLYQRTFTEKRKLLSIEPCVDISDLLASRDDLAIIEKTSSASLRKNTKSSINSVVIGAVPDRGGRTSEQAPPPPEMPPWQQRNAGSGGGGGNFRGGSNRGGSNFSRGGGNTNYSRGGGIGGDSYSQRGNYNYSDSGFNKGSSNYSRGGGTAGNSYSQGGYSDSRGGNNSFDSAGSYGRSDYSQGDRGYSRGGGSNYSREGNDSSRSYTNAYSQDNTNRYTQGGNYSKSSSGYTARGSSGSFDSAGSYGRNSQDYQEPKRAKTYDQFQQNRNTYADQYVEESQHNKQYESRDHDGRSSRGRGGRSNYNRGGGSYR